MRGFLFALGVAALAALGAAVPAAAEAPETSPALYDCRPRNPKMADPPPQPDLPPHVEAGLAEAKASGELEPRCPQGEVPFPEWAGGVHDVVPARGGTQGGASISRSKRRQRGKGAAISREVHGAHWYSYAIGMQEFSWSKNVTALWAYQTNEAPYVEYSGKDSGHSLGQIWALRDIGGGCFSSAETGWRVDPADYGDPFPHLFMFAFDCGAPLGYAYKGLPWQQSSGVVFPGMAVSHNDVFHVYGARLDGNNWWFYYDGHWVGYIPNSAWKTMFPWFATITYAGGEVATIQHNTCTDMGYGGLFGTHPWAAMFSDVWYEYENNKKASSSYMTAYHSDPWNYSVGNWSAGHPGSEFRYGGPGWC